ncbi:hypothetical protein KKC_01332 [Listeria fleischmannii subsp. coloradonensis]|nr:hypothetical protein [Listeria fleischmannii]EIA21390.1 hypothetical protein KKC_01332 [Listeria fleischmannii subsp. coloradonensis]STY35286.1 Uncharacterised protein [Listeria fleischmannii subsp. coloradonensis]
MKSTNELVEALKEEYLELAGKTARLRLALSILPLDDRERELLEKQLFYMNEYGEALLKRVEYAANKEKERAE